jgi:hypothetical protein
VDDEYDFIMPHVNSFWLAAFRHALREGKGGKSGHSTHCPIGVQQTAGFLLKNQRVFVLVLLKKPQKT